MYKLIVGLGNYGPQFNNTRHNIGFVAVDYIARQLDCKIKKLKFEALSGQIVNGINKIIFIKPQTYMNLSGVSVAGWKNYYAVDPENIIVIQDDLNLPLGTVKLKLNGSAGGHNGIKSIINDVQTKNFLRIRIGIGSSLKNYSTMPDFVLGRFSADEQAVLTKAVKKVWNLFEFLVIQHNTIAKTMSLFNND